MSNIGIDRNLNPTYVYPVTTTYDRNFPVEGVDQPSEQFIVNYGVIEQAVENLQSKLIVVTGDVQGQSLVLDSGIAPVPLNLTLIENGVLPGTYPNATVTVDPTGRVTNIASGGPGGGGGAGFSLQLNSDWELDVGSNPVAVVVSNIEGVSFAPAVDCAIYYDFIVPPDYEPTSSMSVLLKFAPSVVGTGQVVLDFAYAVNGGAFSADFYDWTSISVAVVSIQNVTFQIPANVGLVPGDIVVLRLIRRGATGNGGSQLDTYANPVNFLGGILQQVVVGGMFYVQISDNWSLDVGTSVVEDVVLNIEAASFPPAVDSAMYKDVVLGASFAPGNSVTILTKWAFKTPSTGVVQMGLIYQVNGVGFGAPVLVLTSLDPTNAAIQNLTWSFPIAANPGDILSIGLVRYGTSLPDTCPAFASFLGATLQN